MKLLIFLYFVICCFPIQCNELIEIQEKNTIQIKVQGYLENEGLFELPNGALIQDLMPLLLLYDDSTLSHYSETTVLHHNDVIEIMQVSDDRININTASIEQLMMLPEIGEKTAQAIIQYRENHLFQTVDELLMVKGIGEYKFNLIKDYIHL